MPGRSVWLRILGVTDSVLESLVEEPDGGVVAHVRPNRRQRQRCGFRGYVMAAFSPGLLEPRKRAERSMVATVREAYVQGVSTRPVDDLVKALGLDGISKSQVNRLCGELDIEVERFRTCKLDGTYRTLG